MATIKNFEDIEAWKKARMISLEIHKAINEGLFAKDGALRNQINDAAGSVMDNIAEGFERGGTKEFLLFLSYAKSSAGEVRSQLYRALDKQYISASQFEFLKENIVEVSKMLTGLMSYLQKTTYIIKGQNLKKKTPSMRL